MGQQPFDEIDAGLRQGALVVTASERAARALASAYHRARQAEGLTAWTAPNILDWNTFVRTAWQQATLDSQDGRLLLNPTQEQSLWASIASSSGHAGTVLPGPLHRFASMAMEAHQLLCSHAPRLLRASARAGWQNDPAAFSQWLSAFDDACRTANLLSPARLPLELIQLLDASPSANKPGAPSFPRPFAERMGEHEPDPDPVYPELGGQSPRPPLLLAGFDRMLPVQRAFFDAWGPWREIPLGPLAAQVHFHHAPDDQAELIACARWSAQLLARHPLARILVIVQGASARRGQIERAFLAHTPSSPAPLFEFSLGIPLAQVPLPRAAHLLLRWLSGPLAEHELDWLFSTGHAAASPDEWSALQAHMRAIRRRSLERPQWTVPSFISALGSYGNPLPPAWIARVTLAQDRLAQANRRPQSPLDWSELVPQLLQDIAWPGAVPLASAQYQAERRLMQAVETAGSLGYDDRRIDWSDFLSVLVRILDETLFAPESRNAPIQIAGPAESAGLTADALWFLGATEDAWPSAGPTHPLLPPEIQREFRMPHAIPQLDWDLSHAITTRLLASASEVRFSHARQINGTPTRPSRLVVQLAGPPVPLPSDLLAPAAEEPLTELFEDFSRVPFAPGSVLGGSTVLTTQSQCPFRAFATARLTAQTWEPAQAGLTPSQRGQLLHAVLHAVWAGPPLGIRSSADLQQKITNGLPAFVAAHVQRTLAHEMPAALRERMPARYLALEADRLTRLVTEWLTFESARVPFTVDATEVPSPANIAGLSLNLRLDRIDRLIDNTLLVIDYKTGDVTTKSWELPRPDDVQLPLYARFALDPNEELGGLAFAKVRPGDLCFQGRIGDAQATLLPGISSGSALVKNPLTAELLMDWEQYIEQMAKDFLAGHAEVDPRDYPKTCERCGLQPLCRIQEQQPVTDADDESSETEGSDD